MHRFRLHPICRGLRRSLSLASLLAPGLALANPIGGQVVAGSATIGNPAAGSTVINQSSGSAVIDWQQFSIGGAESVVFNQPSAASAVLNRVIGGSASQILGRLSSNGRVYLINPQGVMFGAGARVDVGSLVASTADITDADFMAGRYVFAGGGSGSVSNDGTIVAGSGGFVVLAGDQVRNSGLIQARLGDVILASGSAFTLTTDAAGLVSFAIDSAALSSGAGVTNLGDIVASGGSVLMTAQTARALAGSAVNNQGRVSAQSIRDHGGSIELSAIGGDVAQDGTLDASGGSGVAGGSIRLASDRDITLGGASRTLATGGAGGNVRALAGGTLTFSQGARLDVSALSLTGAGGFAELSGHGRVRMQDVVTLGRAGTLLLDPTTFTIGNGGDISEATLEAQLQSMSEGSVFTISATSSITLLDLADNVLDGRNATAGLGGGLQLQGGDIFFADSNDAIKVDSDLDLSTGTGQQIGVGGLESVLGSVNVFGDTGIDIRGNVVGGSQVQISASNGSVQTSNISSGGGILLDATNGQVAVGDSVTPAALNAGSGVTIAVSGSSVTTHGIALSGAVVANGPISLTTSGSVYGIFASGPISGVDLVDLQSDNLISVADVSVSQSVTGPLAVLQMQSLSNNVVSGNLSVIANNGGSAEAFISGRSVDVNGGITMAGGGATLTGTSGPPTAAFLDITGSAPVTITGQVSLTGAAFHFSDAASGVSGTRGEAFAGISGTSIDIGGGVAINGAGVAELLLSGSSSVTVTGSSVVNATAATMHSDNGQGLVQDERSGAAVFEVFANGGTFSADGVDVTGPNATAFISADLVRLNPDAGGNALVVNAFDAADAVNGAFFRQTQNGVTQIQSTFARADAEIYANLGSSGNPSIAANGLVSVVGPSAFLHLCGPGSILIGNDISGGNIEIGGSGYSVSGDWSLLPFEHDPGGSQGGAELVSAQSNGPGTETPELTSGTLTWGDATLHINNGGTGLPSGPVTVFGDILMSGIGGVQAGISADGLAVEGIGNPLSGIFMDASAGGPGRIQGTLMQIVDVNGSAYQATRQVSDGAGGAATYGDAHFEYHAGSSGSNVDLSNLSVVGLSGSAEFEGGAQVNLGNVQVGGTLGSGTARYVDTTTFVALSGGPAIGPTSTTIVGGENVLSVGFESGTAPARFTANGIDVFGDGVAALVVSAGTIDAGAVGVTSGAGTINSNDPTVVPRAFSGGGDAVLAMAAGAAANVSSVTVDSAGAVHLGGAYDVAGAFAVSTGAGKGVDSVIPAPLVEFRHPLTNGTPDPSATDVPLPATSVNAASIDIGFQAASQLAATLHATGALTLNGNGALLSPGGAIDWSGGTVQLSNVRIGTGAAIALASAGSLTLAGSTLNGSAITLTGAGVGLSNSSLNATGTTSVTSTGALTATSVNINAGTTPTGGRNVALIAATDLTYSGSAVGDQMGMRANGGAMNLSGTLRANRLDLAASGALATGGAALNVDAGSLDASAGGNIGFGQASLSIGGGLATNGHDPALLAALPPTLQPPASAPNAAFVTPGSVDIGFIGLQAGYLFVRAAGASLHQIADNGTLFYNFRPFDDASIIPLGSLSSFNPPPGNNTFVFGGTGYAGDIRFDIAGKLLGNENYVFLTSGHIIGLDQLHTSGQVVVINGSVVTGPPPVQASDAEDAQAAQLAASNMSESGTLQQTSEIQPPADFTPDLTLVDEQTASAEDMQCR